MAAKVSLWTQLCPTSSVHGEVRSQFSVWEALKHTTQNFFILGFLYNTHWLPHINLFYSYLFPLARFYAPMAVSISVSLLRERQCYYPFLYSFSPYALFSQPSVTIPVPLFTLSFYISEFYFSKSQMTYSFSFCELRK